MKCILTAIVLFAQVIAPSLLAQDDLTRIWKDRGGRELKAEFLYFQEGLVGLRLQSGREAAVGLETLSEEDQNFVFEQSVADVFEFQLTEMPHQVRVEDSDILVTGGPTVFETPWFQFENEETISKHFVHEAAQIFEATREAISSLPLGLKTTPPKGLKKFKAQFVTNENFETFLRNSPDISTPDKIAGVYDPKLKSIIVPYDQLGARKRGGRMTLNRSSDTSTLIHEITHQIMHDRLPLVPTWFSEGFAEYMASIPYSDGTFDFHRAPDGLRERLKQQYGSLRATLPPLQELLDQDRNDWRGQTGDYVSSLIYTYYFMHLDQPQAPGSPLAAYLHLLDQAKNDTHRLINSYNTAVHDYNTKVQDYNEQISLYRVAFNAYRNAVRQYNQRVDQYNEELNRGVPPKNLSKLGQKPKPPILPVEPEMPEMLKNREPESNATIDLFQISNDRARPSLLRARDYETIENEIVAKFSAMGINVKFAKGTLYRR